MYSPSPALPSSLAANENSARLNRPSRIGWTSSHRELWTTRRVAASAAVLLVGSDRVSPFRGAQLGKDSVGRVPPLSRPLPASRASRRRFHSSPPP